MRRATPEETSVLRDSLNAVEKGLFGRFLDDRVLAMYQNQVILTSVGVFRLPEEIRDTVGGLRIGTLDEGGFQLDLQGALIMARETDKQSVRVNEQAMRMFLYGKDVLGSSILSWDRSLKRGEHCIVVNQRHEGLGIGQVIGSFKGANAAVLAIHDLGHYLRDGLHSDRGDEGN